jgi:hypothetical protein
MFDALKRVLPDRPTELRVWRGPFRGARIVANPRSSMRKVLGIAGHVICFEPGTAQADALITAARARGGNVRIDVIKALVGERAAPGVVALDDQPFEVKRHTLIKIDVEGAELDVIRGAESWLDATNAFVIEVHHHDYLHAITDYFGKRGIRLRRIDQRPLPLLGRGARDVENWWLVSPPRGCIS